MTQQFEHTTDDADGIEAADVRLTPPTPAEAISPPAPAPRRNRAQRPAAPPTIAAPTAAEETTAAAASSTPAAEAAEAVAEPDPRRTMLEGEIARAREVEAEAKRAADAAKHALETAASDRAAGDAAHAADPSPEVWRKTRSAREAHESAKIEHERTAQRANAARAARESLERGLSDYEAEVDRQAKLTQVRAIVERTTHVTYLEAMRPILTRAAVLDRMVRSLYDEAKRVDAEYRDRAGQAMKLGQPLGADMGALYPLPSVFAGTWSSILIGRTIHDLRKRDGYGINPLEPFVYQVPIPTPPVAEQLVDTTVIVECADVALRADANPERLDGAAGAAGQGE